MSRLNNRLDRIESDAAARRPVWLHVHRGPDGAQTPPPADVERWTAESLAAGLAPRLWLVHDAPDSVSISAVPATP